MRPIAPIALLLIAACARPAADNAATKGNAASVGITKVQDVNAPAPAAEWTGKWVGVEGLVLVIQPGASAAARSLKITLLDGTNVYVGTVAGDTITFTRDGTTETIRHGSGADTGLKYLADKTDCLIIKSGEGFCRG